MTDNRSPVATAARWFLFPGALLARLTYRRHATPGELSNMDLVFMAVVSTVCYRLVWAIVAISCVQ